ncbi:mannosyltransferase family protein [Effusibacillus lacus]|uniref:Glycosyltransferase RgtA/B/C/D-like domain-containing protein n=1 Tax=Effusibacillus lacus TaxID=1348429 RepID=A0A292YRM3_9BACL|nr:mannosyltransferase family protein [Effusibacillus lacus]TCS76804.1 mannosyltransferase PIG-V [Effusibacillus lacus]GAX91135.1 hypothetical protein EFBL_2801 [Effusibacillus lacus]
MTRRQAWLYTFALFLAHKFIVVCGSLVFVRRFVSIPEGVGFLQFALLDNFVRWDSLWYVRIAREGYNYEQPAAFFPLYPYLIRLLHDGAGLSYNAAGLFISNAAFLFALYLLVRLLAKDYSARVVFTTGLLLIGFPTSFYFSAAYTESLFLLWTVGCFYTLRQGKWVWAGAFGFLASLTRNTGILLALPYIYEYLAARKFQWREIRSDLLWISLIPLGIASYMLLLWGRIGDPLGFVHAQKHWGRSFMWPWQTLWQGTLDVFDRPRTGWPRVNRKIEMFAVYWELILLLVSLWKERLRMRRSYLLYAGAAAIVPLLSPSVQHSYFYSIPRFVIVIFPLFVIWGLLLEKKRWWIPVMVLSMAGQWYLLCKFTRGLFVF